MNSLFQVFAAVFPLCGIGCKLSCCGGSDWEGLKWRATGFDPRVCVCVCVFFS